MRILYYNLQLGSYDGSNSHAAGMLAALRRAVGEENVMIANKVERVTYNHALFKAKARLGASVDLARYARKHRQSKVVAADVLARVEEVGFAPDVLLARSTLYDTAPQAIAKGLRCPLVVEANTPFEYECCDVRGVSLRPLVRSFEKRLLWDAAGVYVVSNVLADMLIEAYGTERSKIKVVPNGYSADLYADFGDREVLRAETRAAEGVSDEFVVTFVGSLQTWHGVDRLINAVRLVHADPTSRGVGFWVVGDGPERERVESYAREDRLFRWFGNVDPERMKRLLYASDLGIMPYELLEHFYFSPLKMYDMIGAGLPFLGLGVGQISEVAREYLTPDYLVEDVEPEGYARAIIETTGDLARLSDARAVVEVARRSMDWDARAMDLVGWMGGFL